MTIKTTAAAAALVALGLAAGTAYTDSVEDVEVQTAGYAASTVSGATLNSIEFQHDATGEKITGAMLDLSVADADSDQVVVTLTGTDLSVSTQPVAIAPDGAATVTFVGGVDTEDVTGYSVAVFETPAPEA